MSSYMSFLLGGGGGGGGGFIATVFRLPLPLCGDLNVLVVYTHIMLLSFGPYEKLRPKYFPYGPN